MLTPSVSLPHDTAWFLAIASILLVSTLIATRVKRLPLSIAIFYLLGGLSLGPGGWGLIDLDPLQPSYLLEKLAELAVIVSLFTAGLKLRLPFSAPAWRIILRLASVAMIVSIGLLTLLAHFILDFSWPIALLFAAILAPTDPVLASDVQVAEPRDQDRVRFSLTGEAGLNDGTAFPFVMLGLLLLGSETNLKDLQRWVFVDVFWAIGMGIGLGYGVGWTVGKLVLYLRQEHREAIGLDQFLGLGSIALAYGGALQLHAYGFLAVFAAGLALRQIESQASEGHSLDSLSGQGSEEELASDARHAPTYLTQALLSFNESFERLCEIVLVLLLGALLRWEFFTWPLALMAFLLFVCVRPLAVWISLSGSRVLRGPQRFLISWFGIRGLGSLYYLAVAVQQDMKAEDVALLMTHTLGLICLSIFIHGISVTPLMKAYERWGQRQEKASAPETRRGEDS